MPRGLTTLYDLRADSSAVAYKHDYYHYRDSPLHTHGVSNPTLGKVGRFDHIVVLSDPKSSEGNLVGDEQTCIALCEYGICWIYFRLDSK